MRILDEIAFAGGNRLVNPQIRKGRFGALFRLPGPKKNLETPPDWNCL
jgi:hypothetical protein